MALREFISINQFHARRARGLTIRIRREKLVDDILGAFGANGRPVAKVAMWRPTSVEFTLQGRMEEGQDEGGLSQDMYQALLRALMTPQAEGASAAGQLLEAADAEGGGMWLPTARLRTTQVAWLEALGRAIAKALIDQVRRNQPKPHVRGSIVHRQHSPAFAHHQLLPHR